MADDGFRVGNVLNRAGAVFSQIWVPCSLIYVVQSLPMVLLGLASKQHGLSTGVAASHQTIHRAPTSIALLIVVGELMFLLFSVFGWGVVAKASMSVADGRGPKMGAATSAALARFLPLLGTWICAYFMIMLASLLFVVPGIIVALSYFVITPVCVLEGLGPVASLRRSAALTKGLRWRIFGLGMLFGVLYLVVAVLPYGARLAGGAYAGAAVELVSTALSGVFSTAICVVAYQDMLAVKEGVGGGRIASVFD
jgi:hypothetical protein